MGLGRFELPTPRLSSVCSNQLSYRPPEHAEQPVKAIRVPYPSLELFKEPGSTPKIQATLVLSKLDRRANQLSVVPDRSLRRPLQFLRTSVRQTLERR